MRNPLRDEAAAFRVVLLTLAAFALIALASWVATWLGLAVTAALLAALVVALRRTLRGRRSTRAATVGGEAPARATDGPVLLLLGPDAAGDAEALDRAARAAGPGGSVTVVLPALDVGARAWSSAREEATRAAGERLRVVLEGLRARGTAAEGALGSLDAEAAAREAVRGVRPAALVVAAGVAEDVVGRVRARLGVEL